MRTCGDLVGKGAVIGLAVDKVKKCECRAGRAGQGAETKTRLHRQVAGSWVEVTNGGA